MIFKKGIDPNKSYNIPNTQANRALLKQAREAIGSAKPEQALRLLSNLNLPNLQNELTLLNGRLAKLKKDDIHGVLYYDENSVQFNRISKAISDLITTLEAEMSTSASYDEIIKEYLNRRYDQRLNQKLAGRQPVNLRQLPTTEGTTEETSAAFVAFNPDEVKEHIEKTFADAHGRLLITGVPGAGKTTLLLQLALALLDSATDALPVILNLATWKNEYTNLETWLKEILPTELGTSKRLAADILSQNRLVLLFDGFDEIKENSRASCLAALGRYGADAKRQFALTSRIEEYKQVAKDAPVYLQIEVGALTIEQIETELTRIGHTQPEALPLLYAMRQDAVLREAVKVPFYFNTLQLLFANGIKLSDLHFKSQTVEARQAEITEQFVAFELSSLVGKSYSGEQAKRWLSFLAFNMNRENKVVFELVSLQYWWWKWSNRQLFIGYFIDGVVFTFFTSLFSGILSVLSSSLLLNFGKALNIGIGSFLGTILTGGFYIAFKQNQILRINVKDRRKWSWHLYIESVKEKIAMSIILSQLLIILSGMFFSYISSLLIGFSLGSIFCLGHGLFDYVHNNNAPILQITHPYERFNASSRVLHFSILQHKHLLYLLSRKGLLPYRLVNFLNDMVEQKILECPDEATWRFRHQFLQNYFAEQKFE